MALAISKLVSEKLFINIIIVTLIYAKIFIINFILHILQSLDFITKK